MAKEKQWIIIGDIHGCLDAFQKLLRACKWSPDDQVILLGDTINRGPDSHGVLKLARKIKAIGLWGNHELRLWEARKRGSFNELKFSDQTTYKSLTDKDWSYLSTFKPYLAIEKWNLLLVHGGFIPGKTLEDHDVHTLTHIQVIEESGDFGKRSDYPKGKFWCDLWKGPQFVLYGHTPRAEVYQSPMGWCLDTGCVMGGKLTACVFPGKRLVQVEATKAYYRKTTILA